MRLKISISLLLACLLAGSTLAQTYDLADCRRLALENNRSLKAATEQERIAYYQKKEALMNFFPAVAATGVYLHLSENAQLISQGAIPTSITLPAALGGATIPVSEATRQAIYGATEVDLSNNWIAGVNLMQPLFAGGKIMAYNDLRAYALELTSTMKESRTQDVIVETDQAYWQVVSLSAKCNLARAYASLMEKLGSDVAALYEEGMATRADKLSVDVRRNEADLTLMKAENGLSLARMLLCQVCGIEVSDQVTTADETRQVDPQQDYAYTAYDVDRAIDGRSEVRSLELASKIALQQQKIAFAEYLPTVGLTTGYNWTNPNLKDGVSHKFGGMWDVGVAVSVPLNFGSASAKHNAAKAQARKSQWELEDAREKIRLQIAQSDYKLAQADKKLAAAERNTASAEENHLCADEGFREGVIPVADLMSAQTAWLAAQAELIDARIDRRLCRLYLDKALGNEL